VSPPSLVTATLFSGVLGLVYSPPTTTPFRASLNATEKIPAAEPPAWSGVSATRQVRPRSVDRNTRARSPPPVPIQTFDVACTVSQVPLAANAASPGNTGGAASV